MKRKILCYSAGLVFASLCVQAQQHQPLLVSSGFNEKVIAYSNLPATATTTAAIDNEDRGLMNTTFSTVWGMPGPSYALPVDGLITSATTSGIFFQMAAANTANVLRIADQNVSGTLAFNDGAHAAGLYLLATSGSGSTVVSVTVHFTDNTSQQITDVQIPNWIGGDGQPIALQGFGYVKREMNEIQNPANEPRLFQIALDILPENEEKTVGDIVVTKTSAAEGVVNVFAVTAEITNNCPTPAPGAENQVTCAGNTLSALVIDTVEGGVLTWYDAQNGGNILDPNLPVGDTTYYVSQTAEGCESNRTAFTVTVNPGPHVPEGEDLQDFTEGQTVADLEVAFEDGTTVVWFIVNDAGESITLPETTLLVDGETYFVAQILDGCRGEALSITVTEILGVNGHTALKIMAYPNPAGENITVSAGEDIKGIMIMNMLGQKLLEQQGNGRDNTINLSGLASGNYILSLTAENGTSATVKLIKN